MTENDTTSTMITTTNVAAMVLLRLRVLVATTVVMFVALVCLGAWVYNGARSNTESLCALRTDLENRVVAAQAYLDAPASGGSPAFPANSIRDSIANQKRTIKALSNLSC